MTLTLDFQALFRALPSPHMVLDRDLRYVDVNPAYEEAVSCRRDDLVGRNLFEMFPGQGDNDRRLKDSIHRVFDTGRPDTLAYIPYAIPRPPEDGGGLEHRVWTAVHVPLRAENGEVTHVLQNTVDVTDITKLRADSATAAAGSELDGQIALLQRAQEVEEAFEATRQESSRFRQLFQQAPGMIAVLSGPDHVVTFANDAFQRFVGGRALIGQPLRDAVPEIEGQGLAEQLDSVFAAGRSFVGEGVRVLVRRGADAPAAESFVDVAYDPVRDAAGSVTGIFLQGSDRTDSVRAKRRQRVLVDELNHRVKNTLAAVQSIARQSFRNISDPEAARYAFEARILALSKAHNLLSERQWEGASLHELLRQELAETEEGRVTIEGPDAELSAKSIVALAMVFHELAMNAARHGALGVPGGRVAVRFAQPAGPDSLGVSWQETGVRHGGRGAAPAPGFGIRLLRRIVEGELGGRFELDFASEGVICRFEIVNPEGLDD